MQAETDTITGQIQVNTTTPGTQENPTVAVDAAGRFVVAWQADNSQDTDGYGIFFRVYDSSGLPGPETQANTLTIGAQTAPSVAMDDDGTFVIAWQSVNGDGNGSIGIRTRLFDAAATPLTPDFQVNRRVTTGDQVDPSVAMDAAGNFVIVWQSATGDGDGNAIRGQRFDAAGAPQGRRVRRQQHNRG